MICEFCGRHMVRRVKGQIVRTECLHCGWIKAVEKIKEVEK